MIFYKKSAPPKPLLSQQPDRPAGVFEDPAGKFAEIYGGAKVSQQRMFLLAAGAMILAAGAVIALFLNAQKSVAVPWLVEVNAVRGIVSKPVRIESVRPSDAVIKAEIARWATKVFTIDKALSPQLFREANVMTKGLGEAQFTAFRVQQNVIERMTRDPSLQRKATVSSIDVSQPGVAFVFVATQEASGTNANTASTRYRLTVKYELTPPKTEAEILANPLGLYITSMNVSEEGAVR